MNRYTLRYANGPEGDQVVDFEAVSMDAALRVAKSTARGDWAELYQDEMPICRMRAVDEDVWRIARLDRQD